MIKKNRPIYLSLFVIIVIIILSIFLIDKSYKNSNYQKKTLIKSQFNLIDNKGSPVTNETYYGKFTLIFFGFTFCPDVCPNTLNKISSTYDLLEEDVKKNLKVIFITVDPERDTPNVLNEYLLSFNHEFIGLTGSIIRINEAAQSMGVYYKKNIANGEDNDYLIDHSSIKFLMDKKGNYLAHFSRELTAEELSIRISQKIKDYK